MIKFPAVHVAESVKNRILDIRDELKTSRAPTPALPVPNAPELPAGDTSMAGALIDYQTQSTTPALEAPENAGLGGAAGLVAQGEDLIAGL